MAKRKTRIPVVTSDELRPEIDKQYPNVTSIDWCGKEIFIRKAINMDDMFEFVDAVTEACIDGSGNYLPQFRDFMFRLYTVIYYTNIAPTGELNEQYRFIYGSPLFDLVVKNVDYQQLTDINRAIGEKIRFAINSAAGIKS